MLRQSFTIPKYGWKVYVYYYVTCYYINEIIHKLKSIGCNGSSLRDAYNNMADCKLNTGLTYSNRNSRKSLMVISSTSTPDQFMNSYLHETKHLERHIEEYFEMNPYGEEAAYLSGTIGQLMFPKAKYFLCDCYRKSCC